MSFICIVRNIQSNLWISGKLCSIGISFGPGKVCTLEACYAAFLVALQQFFLFVVLLVSTVDFIEMHTSCFNITISTMQGSGHESSTQERESVLKRKVV